MVHLSSPTMIGIMVFYSFLTFFIGPLITRPFLGDHPRSMCCRIFIRIHNIYILWMKFGRHYAKK